MSDPKDRPEDDPKTAAEGIALANLRHVQALDAQVAQLTEERDTERHAREWVSARFHDEKARADRAEASLREIAEYDRDSEAEDCPTIRAIARAALSDRGESE